jgi:prepilin-type N-terminal cleavage/methylation domain-containing protein
MPSELPARCPATPTRLDRAGLTLLEVLTVIVLIGIVAAIGLPRIDFAGAKANAAARALSLAMSRAQREAVTLQSDVWVAVDSAGRALVVHEDRNNDGLVQPGERVTTVALDEGVVFGTSGAPPLPMGAGTVSFTRTHNGLPAVVFHRDGSASESGGFYLTTVKHLAAGKPTGTRAVTVAQATGRPLWWSYGSGTWVSAR